MTQHTCTKSKAAAIFCGTIITLAVLLCGIASADLVYINDSGTLVQVVDSQGNTNELSISGDDVHSFTHNGQPRLLVTTLEGDIMVFDPENMSEPLSSGTLTAPNTYDEIGSIAELGSNLVIAYGSVLYEVNPETCEVVNTYSLSSSGSSTPVIGDEGVSYIYPYGGQIVAEIEQVTSSSGGRWGFSRIVTMDTLGHITGTFDDFEVYGVLEASGGELYFALGDSDYIGSSEAAQHQGIYRVSRMLGNMNVNNAVRVTSDNPRKMTRDGKGGLYYTAFGSDTSSPTPQYIYHWDGNTTSQVYYAGSGYAIDNIAYDINDGVLYAEIIDSSYNVNITALTAGSDGNFTSSNSFGYHSFTVMGNPVDSSSGSNGGTVVPDNPSTPTQTTELPVGVIEPAPPLSDDVLQNIASLVSKDASDLRLISRDNIAPPQEPTKSMTQYMHDDGYEAAYKLNTLTVSEDGYYVFLVNVPEEFIGKKISDIRIYALKNADFAASIPGVITGLLNFTEITNLAGLEIDTLEAQVLAVAVLQAGTPFSVYLAKILLALLAGGCSLSGTGTLMLCVTCLAGIYVFRKR